MVTFLIKAPLAEEGLLFTISSNKDPRFSLIDSSEKYELIYGYLIHYSIGIIYGFFYILINIIFYEEPSILIALVFGVTTILGAWCIMMPFAYNLGFFASKSDEKYHLIVQGLLAHFVFGTGLFIGYSIVY